MRLIYDKTPYYSLHLDIAKELHVESGTLCGVQSIFTFIQHPEQHSVRYSAQTQLQVAPRPFVPVAPPLA